MVCISCRLSHKVDAWRILFSRLSKCIVYDRAVLRNFSFSSRRSGGAELSVVILELDRDRELSWQAAQYRSIFYIRQDHLRGKRRGNVIICTRVLVTVPYETVPDVFLKSSSTKKCWKEKRKARPHCQTDRDPLRAQAEGCCARLPSVDANVKFPPTGIIRPIYFLSLEAQGSTVHEKMANSYCLRTKI